MPRTNDLQWRGDKLMLGTRNTGVKTIPESKWPGMFRVEYPPGTISDMVNLSRARDAAVYIVTDRLNRTTAKAAKEAVGVVVPSSGVRYHPATSGLTQPSSAARN
jgi:hypothetical protein